MDKAFREFLVWFDGFCENVEKVPNQKQWNRLMAKLFAAAGQSQFEDPVAPGAVGAAVPVVSQVEPAGTAPAPAALSAEPSEAEIDQLVADIKRRGESGIVTTVPTTETVWRLQYKMRLKELGMEDADAKDQTKLAVYNANIDARKQATADYHFYYPGTDAA